MPPALQQATANPRLHRRLLDTHGQVWVSLLWGHCSFLLGPSAQGSVSTLQGSVPPVLCKFWQLYGGVNGDLLQEGLCHTQVCCTQSPVPATEHYQPIPPQEMLKHSSVSISVGSLGRGAHNVCLSPQSISGGNGVCFYTLIRPSYHLVGSSPLCLEVSKFQILKDNAVKMLQPICQ